MASASTRRTVPPRCAKLAPQQDFTALRGLGVLPSAELEPPAALHPGQSPDHNTLEIPVGATMPVNLKLHMQFKADSKDQAFDFTFPAYSKEP